MVAAGWGHTVSSSGAVPEGQVEFQDGSGNVPKSFYPGQIAHFFVRDAELSTVLSATGTWTSLSDGIPANTWISLASGSPEPGSYQLADEGRYDRVAPANTPIHSVPTAKVNGVPVFVGDLRENEGTIKLVNDANAGSTLEIRFEFHIVDGYPAQANRAKVTSSSDPGGEWVSIAEVVSETQGTLSPTSGLFRGAAELSDVPAAVQPGDGSVWVRYGDILAVDYHEDGGGEVVDTHTVAITPPPVPALEWLSTVVLAGLLTAALGWRHHLAGLRGK